MSVSSLKFSKITFSIESLVILVALISFLSSVSLLIYNNMRECLITIATLKWLLPSVISLMDSTVILQGESLITLDALKWFLPSVSYLVSYKIILRIESLATFVAFLKFCLQCVSSYGCFCWYCPTIEKYIVMAS